MSGGITQKRENAGKGLGGGGPSRELVRGDVGDGHRPRRHPDPHLPCILYIYIYIVCIYNFV